ncbi:MAG: hypothetical protein LRZ93_02315 [Clostridiales bacterium]|nr:hypothetical protein [Clostridiales bacterium]
MRIKKISVLCFYLVLMISVIPIYASDDSESLEGKVDIIQPNFTNISVFSNNFEITDKGKAMLTSSITARNVDEIRISMYLQRYQSGGWRILKRWTTTQFGNIAVLGGTWYVVSGYQYRILSYAYAYQGGRLIESTSYVSGSIIY